MVRDSTTRAGLWPSSRRVVRFGLSLRTVVPPTTTASDRARSAQTCCLAAGPVTHALCPEVVAIFPSMVMAYLKTLNGLPVATL